MWKDILTILFIITVSYIFSVSEIKKFDQQMIFILLTLMVLVLYKIIHFKQNVSENFQNINAADITRWVGSSRDEKTLVSAPNNDTVTALKTEADKINENLQKNIEELSKVKNILLEREQEKENDVNKDYVSSLDTRNMQTSQNIQLKSLQTDIENANILLKELEMEKSTRKYPKIPIYSSCVVSNPDGSYNLDTPNIEQQGAVQNQNKYNAAARQVASSPRTNNDIVNLLKNVINKGVNLNIDEEILQKIPRPSS